MRNRAREATIDDVVEELRYAVDNGGANGVRCNLWANDLAEIAARLAADQQKGGGEVVAWIRVKPDGCPDWAEDCLTDDHDRFLDNDLERQGYSLRPLIYADSAPVGVDGLLELADRVEGLLAVSSESDMRAEQDAISERLRDLAHLKAAPQPSIPAPAQQDGKASGGEATVPACRRCGSTNLKNVSTKGGEGKSCVECGNFRFNGPEDAR